MNTSYACFTAAGFLDSTPSVIITRRPACADRTARRQFQAVFPVITASFPINIIAHLHGLSMDLTVGQTVGPTVDATVG